MSKVQALAIASLPRRRALTLSSRAGLRTTGWGRPLDESVLNAFQDLLPEPDVRRIALKARVPDEGKAQCWQR